MRILLIHQFFNTPERGGSLRSYYLAKALTTAGHSVTVITTHPAEYPVTDQVEGIEVHYLPVDYRNSYGFFRRVYAFCNFVLRIVNRAAQFRHADVCYAISAPLTTGLAAIWIKKRYRIPYYFEVGDLWPEAPVQLGVVRNYFLKKILYRLEASIYKRAVAVVALSSAIRQHIISRFPRLTVYVIPNMADTDFFMPEPKNPETEKRLGTTGKFVVSYIGTLGIANGLDYLVACAALAENEKLNLHLLVCGDGKMREELEQSIGKKQLKNISLLPHRGREGVKEILNVTDAVMVCFRPLPVLETGSPNKYFDGLAAGKLMVVNTGGWMKEEVEREQCGIAVNPHDANDFAEKIRPFITDKAMLGDYRKRARRLAETRYSRKLLGAAFINLLLKI